ncbi:MAG: hypothetical protein ACT4PX_12845 [Actinomycetota bacterium]
MRRTGGTSGLLVIAPDGTYVLEPDGSTRDVGSPAPERSSKATPRDRRRRARRGRSAATSDGSGAGPA